MTWALVLIIGGHVHHVPMENERICREAIHAFRDNGYKQRVVTCVQVKK